MPLDNRRILGIVALLGLGFGAPEACGGIPTTGSVSPQNTGGVTDEGGSQASVHPKTGSQADAGSEGGQVAETNSVSVGHAATGAATSPSGFNLGPEPVAEGLVGAAQLLAQGTAELALTHLDTWLSQLDGVETGDAATGKSDGKADSKSSEHSAKNQELIVRAIAGRAYRLTGEFALSVGHLEKLYRHKERRLRCGGLPCQLVGYELAQARLGWAEQGSLDSSAANKQLKLAEKELKAAISAKPTRYRAPMRIALVRVLGAMQSDVAKTDRVIASKALRSLDRVLADYPNFPQLGELGLLQAQLQRRKRDVNGAAQTYRRLAVEHSGHPVGEKATLGLTELSEAFPKKAKPLTWSRSEQLERAQRARETRHVVASRSILDALVSSEVGQNRAIKAGASEGDEEGAHEYLSSGERQILRSRASTAYRQRDYEQCANDLERLYQAVPSQQSRNDLSRCLDRAGKAVAAVELWASVANRKGANKHTKASSFWRALELAFRGGEYQQATTLLKDYESVSNGHTAERAWMHAWLPYRLGKTQDAIKGFEKLVKRKLKHDQARYFLGKLLIVSEDQVKHARGKELLHALIAKDPFSYYGLQAYQRLSERSLDVPAVPELLPMEDEAGRPNYDQVRSQFATLQESFPDYDKALGRAESLHQAGWIEEARREFRVAADVYINGRTRLSGGKVRIPRNEEIVVGLAWREEWDYPKVYPDAKSRAYLRGENSNELRDGLRELARGLDEPYRFARLSSSEDYPYRARWLVRAFRPHVERAALERGTDAYELWALMYTESRFRRHVVSSVGARGALQIMPWTGRQIQQRLGVFTGHFNPDTLFEIETNASMASYYIEQLLTKFQGQSALAYASYNGGPSNVSRWVQAKTANVAETGLDDFIEEIPFQETYRYTKRVLEVGAAYRWMYEKKTPGWSNQLNVKVENNIDF